MNGWIHRLLDRVSGAETRKIVRDNQKATKRLGESFNGHPILEDIDDLFKGNKDEQSRS